MTGIEFRDGRRRAIRQLREALVATSRARQAVQSLTTAFVQISQDPPASISKWEEVVDAEAYLDDCLAREAAARAGMERFINRDPIAAPIRDAVSVPAPGEPES